MVAQTKHSEIVVAPPGPKARELLARDESYLTKSAVRWYPLVAESASGSIVEDVDGKKYIDFNAGLGVMSVGHSHPRVVQAINDQTAKLLHYSWTDFYYRPIVDLAEQLTKIAPGNFPKRVFFSNSGAEAIEAAMKITRWHS